LLRSFLEKAIKAYAERLGEDIRDPKQPNKYVFLADALLWLENHFKGTSNRAYVQVVIKIRTGKLNGYVPSMDHLNAINHNHHIMASTADVRESWSTMKSLMTFLLKP
jgi:hypothetical protein